ncbi:MAG: insulinase family protein [bacterium]|nr:insulinase family protein [bacterium]
MTKKTVLLALLLTAISASSAILYEGILDNGLRYFIYSDEEMATSSFNVYVNTGSNTEAIYGGAGISHYVEHLVAGGSTKFNDEKSYNDTLQSIGASMNAYTSNEVTCYFIASSEEFKETAIRTLSEWVLHCSFDSAQVAREKGVIEKEIIMYDTPSNNIYYDYAEEIYKDSPAKYPVTGYLDVFKSITRENVLDYYNRMYVPENMTVVFAGNLDIKETKELIEKHFKSDRRFFKEEKFNEPDYTRAPSIKKINYDIENKKVYVGYYLGYDSKKQRAITDVLSYMLCGNSEMLFEKELISKSKLASSIDIYTENMSGLRSVFTIYFETDSTAESVAEKSQYFIDMINKSDKFKKLFDDAKKRLIANYKFMTLNSFNAVGMIYDGYIKFSDPKYFLKELALLDEVKFEDVQNLVKQYLHEPYVLSAEREKVESYPERKSFKIINFTDEVLSNGNTVRIYNTQNKDYSLMFVSFPYGYKDGSKKGAASFVRGIINEKIETSDFIKKTLSRHFVSVNENNSYIGLKVTSENTKAGLDYLTGLLKDLSFSNESFERQKAMLRNRAKTKDEDPADVAYEDFQRLFVENGDYTVSPSVEEIDAVMKEDIKTELQNMASGNQKIFFWGAYDREKVKEFAKNLFKEKKIFTREIGKYKEFQRDSNNTDNDQSNIFIAYFTNEEFTEKELYALSMFNSFFRGSKSFIHEALRGDNDLVYYGYGYLEENNMVPAFIMNAQTSDEKTERAIEVMEKVFDRISAGDFEDSEIDERKKEQLLRIRFEFTNPERTLISDMTESYSPFKDKKYYLNDKIGWVTKEEMLLAVKKLTKFKSKLIYR